MTAGSSKFPGKIGDRVRIEFEGIITSLPKPYEDEHFTVKSEDGFSQIVNVDYPGVLITTQKEESNDQS